MIKDQSTQSNKYNACLEKALERLDYVQLIDNTWPEAKVARAEIEEILKSFHRCISETA